MSRRKNQTVKLFKDYYRAGQLQLCDLGEVFAYDQDTAEIIQDLQAVAAGPPLDLCRTPNERHKMTSELERGKVELGVKLVRIFTEAIGSGKLDRVKRLVSATEMASRGAVSPNYL